MNRIQLVFVAVLSLAAPRAGAVSLGFDPSAALVAPSDTVVLQIVASDLGGAVLGDFDLDVSFDASLLAIAAVTLGESLGTFDLGDALDFGLGETAPGTLNLAVVSTLASDDLDALQEAAFVLATLEFTVGAITPGALTQLTIAVHALGDGDGATLPVGALGDASLRGVPEPATLVLLGAALAGLAQFPATRNTSKLCAGRKSNEASGS